MAGVEVGAIESVGADWDADKVLVGRVLKVDRHPNADRLTLPTVDLGDGETATVVCGAPNVATGQMIAFAREGAMLFSPRSKRVEPLKAARIRGVVSTGMVCSELELGLGEGHEGILVLNDDAPLGAPLVDYLGDSILDVEITPNRPDCLSLLGVAREVAALTGCTVTEPELHYAEEGATIEDQVNISIADPDLCYRYTASLVTGIEIAPSPRWLQDALSKAGQRPINNVVDITNYVMLEFGEPLHAFDFEKVKDRTIVVRAARSGELLLTLDGVTRKLQPPMLTIADSRDAVGLAGVMGGVNSEMHEGTTSVLLESANFDPVNTRRTASTLRLHTEASYRFERGIRAELAPLGLRRATQLILEIAGGTAAKGIIDLYPSRREPPVVKISRGRLKQVLGADIEMQRVEEVLVSLGFTRARVPEGMIDLSETVEADPISERESMLWMKAPYWRSDIAIEDDLVEEVARIVGYDDIPTTMISAPVPHREPHPERSARERIRDILAGAGMQEIISYPLTNLESLRNAGALNKGPEPIRIANPLNSAHSHLRTSLRGSALETLAANMRTNQGQALRLFEIGRVYVQKEEARERDLPDEKEVVIGVLSGLRFPASWVAPQADMDFFDAKGVLEAMFEAVGLEVTYESTVESGLRPGRTARVVCGGKPLGVVGEVPPPVLERFDLGDSPVALFEIDLESLLDALPKGARLYQAASRYPGSERDLALLVDGDVPSASIQAIIEGHKLVVSATPFDVYSGDEVPAGKKSLAYRVVFQSRSATLTADQVSRAQKDILRRLRSEHGAELRG